MTELAIPLSENVSRGDDHVGVGGETFTTTVPRRNMPFFVYRDQLYYWTREWQDGEEEALREIAEGRFQTFQDGQSAADAILKDED
jgi:hypothetical protein